MLLKCRKKPCYNTFQYFLPKYLYFSEHWADQLDFFIVMMYIRSTYLRDLYLFWNPHGTRFNFKTTVIQKPIWSLWKFLIGHLFKIFDFFILVPSSYGLKTFSSQSLEWKVEVAGKEIEINNFITDHYKAKGRLQFQYRYDRNFHSKR